MSHAFLWAGIVQTRRGGWGVSPGKRRANNLDGRTWTRYSISVWNDIRKNREEKKLSHPALFPLSLVERLLEIFTIPGDSVLDPFIGSGSTLLGAKGLGRQGIGLEISEEYVELFHKRCSESSNWEEGDCGGDCCRIIQDDARNMLQHLSPESIDFCLTSPPYWNILKGKRTADHKPSRHYGDDRLDLGNIEDYRLFLAELEKVFRAVYSILKGGKYCCVVVMDIRKKNVYYPLHMDLSNLLVSLGFVLDDIIIWDRRDEYNNLRPLGFPHVFRVNKIHEFILIFQKRSSD